MPQGRRSKKAQKARKPKQPNMVVVSVTSTPNGRELEVGTTGDIRLTEAPTLLRLGAKIAEEKLGVEK